MSSQETIRAISNEIKGVVLAGGRGTRLKPLTDHTNKHLLPVGDKPLVYYPIEQLVRAGVKDIYVLIAAGSGSQFMEILKDGKHLGVNSLAYVWQPEYGPGLPSALAQVQSLTRDAKIIAVCSDVIIEDDLTRSVEKFANRTMGSSLVATCIKDTAGYSKLLTEGNNVLEILPKDQNNHTPGLIDLGVYMYHPDVFQKIKELTVSPRGETEIWDLNKTYILKSSLFFSQIQGWWCDVGGSLSNYQEANARYGKE